MPERLFMDGTGITPGTEGCKCDGACEFPCFQRIGLAPACKACGCAPFEEDPYEQKETRTDLGALKIERLFEGIGRLEYFCADAGQWMTKANKPAKVPKRTYTLHHVNGESIEMESTSKIPGCLHKEALLGWYEDHGARGGAKLQALGELEDCPPEEIIDRVRFHNLGARDQLSQAASRGTGIHGILEQLAAGVEPDPADMPSDWLPWFEGAVRAWEALDPDAVEVEQIVCHPEDRYAGRPDLVAYIDGRLTLVDWKTNPRAGVYKEGHFQARLYERARRRCGLEPCERLIVVGIGQDGQFFISDGITSEEEAEWLLHTFRSAQRHDRALAAQRKAAA